MTEHRPIAATWTEASRIRVAAATDEHGIQVVDQWNVREGGRIVEHLRPSERTFNLGQPWVDRGESYNVVEQEAHNMVFASCCCSAARRST